jgi:hypothetical protein
LVLVAVGALVATRRLHGRRKAPVPAGGGQPEKNEKKDGWAQRVLAEPRLGLAMVIGALCGIPGGAYLSALFFPAALIVAYLVPPRVAAVS